MTVKLTIQGSRAEQDNGLRVHFLQKWTCYFRMMGLILAGGCFLSLSSMKVASQPPGQESSQTITIQAGPMETIDITKSLLASKDINILAVGAQVTFGSYDASASNDFSAGSDFTSDNGTRLKNFFNGVKDNACIAVKMGTEWQQAGQTGRDNRVTFLGSPSGAPTPSIFVDLVQPGDFFNTTLTTPLSAVSASDFGSCNTPSLGSVSGAGLALTNTSPGNTAENATRHFKGEIGYTMGNLKTTGTRVHSFQIRVEAVAGQ